MRTPTWCLFLASFCVGQTKCFEASYHCGIRKHSFVELVHRGYNVEEGQWPWHVGLFHKKGNAAPQYACGGTLLDHKHVLTAAHCALNRDTRYPLPATAIELHFGQLNLSEVTRHVQIRDVSEVRIHPEYSTHRNDIAVLVMRLPVEYTDFVIPICMDQRADRDLRNLEGQRGWIAGWGTMESGVISDALRTASMPVVSYLQCFNDDPTLFGNVLNSRVFCAGDRNGTSPGTGDSGGGMYFSEGDRWVLRGIVSFAKVDELKEEVDTSKYAVFVNVQQFLTWTKEIMNENEAELIKRPKRISEQECDRFKSIVQKKSNGICRNSRHPHTATVFLDTNVDLVMFCSGFLVNENHVITAAECVSADIPTKVQIEATIHEVSNWTHHPRFSNRGYHFNLAIVKLKTSVKLSRNMVPACLASNWTENLYDTLLHTGWGVESGTSIDERTFIESDANQIINSEECQRSFKRMLRNFKLDASQLCVLNKDRLRTRAIGLYGSPLQSFNSRTCMHTVVGVFNVGDLKDGFSIHICARVAYALDWIEQIVWNVEPPMRTTVGMSEEESTATVGSTINYDFVFPEDTNG